MQLSLRNYIRKESAEVSILLSCNSGMRILTSLYRVCSHKYALFSDENLYVLSLSPALFKLIGKFIYEIFVFVLGIKIGEIGTKLGMNATNNGFLGFENVRIPRENMLMKNSQVTEKINHYELVNRKCRKFYRSFFCAYSGIGRWNLCESV